MNEARLTIHRLSLNVRDYIGPVRADRALRSRGEGRSGRGGGGEEGGGGGGSRREGRRPSSPNYTLRPAGESRSSLAHSLASKILIGCAWMLHRRPTTGRRRERRAARGSEVERCSIDSCREAASTPRVGEILSRVSLPRYFVIYFAFSGSDRSMPADNAAWISAGRLDESESTTRYVTRAAPGFVSNSSATLPRNTIPLRAYLELSPSGHVKGV